MLVVVVLAVSTRLALPSLIRWQINRQLANSESVEGRVGDVDLSILRAAATIHGVELRGRDPSVPLRSLKVESVTADLRWRGLLKGRLVVDLRVNSPRIVARPVPARKEKKKGPSLQQELRDAVPFRVDTLVVTDGRLDYPLKDPPLRVEVNRFDLTVENLTNLRGQPKGRYASARLDAKVMDSGKLLATVEFDPVAEPPTMSLNVELRKLALKRLNPATRDKAGFDFEGGSFDLMLEAATKEGRISGYAKPLLEDVSIVDWSEDKGSPVKLLWESLLGAAETVLQNQPKERLATRIPISGELDDPKVGVGQAAVNILRNALVKVFQPVLERSIDLGSVKDDKGGDKKRDGKDGDKKDGDKKGDKGDGGKK